QLPSTTLQAAISGTATTLTGANAAAFANAVNGVIQIDSEKMLITAVDVTSNTLTVQRAYNFSAAAPHLANTGVQLLYTPTSLGSAATGQVLPYSLLIKPPAQGQTHALTDNDSIGGGAGNDVIIGNDALDQISGG